MSNNNSNNVINYQTLKTNYESAYTGYLREANELAQAAKLPNNEAAIYGILENHRLLDTYNAYQDANKAYSVLIYADFTREGVEQHLVNQRGVADITSLSPFDQRGIATQYSNLLEGFTTSLGQITYNTDRNIVITSPNFDANLLARTSQSISEIKLSVEKALSINNIPELNCYATAALSYLKNSNPSSIDTEIMERSFSLCFYQYLPVPDNTPAYSGTPQSPESGTANTTTYTNTIESVDNFI